MQLISRDHLRSLLDDGDLVLVEALPEPQFAAEHLPGGGRSKAAAAAYSRLGYTDVRVYTGGKADWAEAGLPFDGTRATSKAAR